ncbi:MAG: S24 family peptidase [Erysipelotrichaceae bacterium]
MKLNEILREFKSKHNITNDYIAAYTGASKSCVSRWISGEIKSVKGEKAKKLSNLLGFDIETYLKGAIINFKKPILGEVKAGYDYFAQENYLGYEEVTEYESRKGDYFLKVVGTSMEGAKIHDGDLVYVEACKDVISGSIAVVLIDNSEVTIKKIIKAPNTIILEAANPNVETRYFNEEDLKQNRIEIIGKVLYSKTLF